MEKTTPTEAPGQATFLAFQRLLAAAPPAAETWPSLIADLQGEGRLELALAALRQARPDPALWGPFQAQLREAVAKARIRRMSLWQVDPRRRTLRLRFQVEAPATDRHPSAMLALLAKALLDAGLPLAMGLEKNPRPAVQLGHPLPLGVAGLSEWADAVLQEGPGIPLEALPGRLNATASAGLTFLECLGVPNHASPVADLCRRGHWLWPCPPELLAAARAALDRFLAAAVFEMAKPGKQDGQRGPRQVDIRGLLDEVRWEGAELAFRTRISGGEAANPRKLLAAILGLEPAAILGLRRIRVELAEDPRLLQGHKFEPKLHNMFEDAVLLEAGSNIRIIDEDEDEPLRLG
jgi:hypothetical protein